MAEPMDAAFDSIQRSQLCLLHRRDGIVDRETRFLFKLFGVLLGVFHISIVFGAGNAGLQDAFDPPNHICNKPVCEWRPKKCFAAPPDINCWCPVTKLPANKIPRAT
jgi:hypothetical protein